MLDQYSHDDGIGIDISVMNDINTVVVWLWDMITGNWYMLTFMGAGLVCLGLRVAAKGKRFARWG